MKEAIGNSAIFTIAIVLISLVIAVFLSSLNYSKAFKIKTNIVDIIENYEDGYIADNRDRIDTEIEEYLREAGYRVNTNNQQCPVIDGRSALNNPYNYRYCIYEYSSTRGNYYRVVTYMYLDIPLLSNVLQFQVAGQTKVFYHVVDNGIPTED